MGTYLMDMNGVDLLNLIGIAASVVVVFVTLRAGVSEARQFRKLTGDDSTLVSVLAFSRVQREPAEDVEEHPAELLAAE